MTTTWRLRPEYAGISLQAKDVAALFVSVTSNWYDDPANTLFRKKAQVYNLILNYLQTGLEPDNLSHELIYALGKFQTEWFEYHSKNATIFEENVA